MTSKSCNDVATKMAEDAASLTRVRNRFSNVTDQRLPKIMGGLLPKLLKRLEDYSVTSAHVDEQQQQQQQASSTQEADLVTLSHLRKAQHDIHGIFATALERIRGNPRMPTESLIPVLLPFVGSNNAVVGTWALALTQAGISRVTASSLHPCSVAILLELLGKFHDILYRRKASDGSEVEENSTPDSYVTQSLESRWVRTTWLLLDFIMIFAGHKPLVDWDVQHFDPKQSQQVDDVETDANSPYSLAKMEATKVLANQDCPTAVAFTSLLLDLILFWPNTSSQEIVALSPLASKRMNFRSNRTELVIEDDNADPLFWQRQQPPREAHPGLPMQFQRQVRQRGPQSSWTDMTKLYLRYVKLAALRFAIWPMDRGVLGGQAALLLSFCAANFDSMHGRVAVDIVKHREAENLNVPVPVALSVIILILGEKASIETLEQVRNQNTANDWGNLLGTLTGQSQTQRPPLPNEIATKAAQFLIDSEVQWADGEDGIAFYGSDFLSLMMELCLAMCRQHTVESQFLAIRLVGCLFDTLPKRTLDVLALQIKAMVEDVLSNVVDGGLANLEEMRRHPRREGVLPLGVHAPFDRRHDLDRLLSSHRQLLKRKHLRRDEAMEARKEAYRLISLLPVSIIDYRGDEPFQLPNLLLQCAVYEDRSLEYYTIKAVDHVLNACTEKLNGELSSRGAEAPSIFQQQAMSLLPSLLETVCSEEASTRSIGISWIKKLLIKLDEEAATYLASHLVNDQDDSIARAARKLVSSYTTSSRHSSSEICTTVVEFYDMSAAEQALVIRWKLEERVHDLSRTADLPPDLCQKLLLYHDFSIAKVMGALHESSEDIMALYGLNRPFLGKRQGNFACGICYDNVETARGYSLQCGHEFCVSCWTCYMDEASESKSLFLGLRCPEQACETCLLRTDIEALSPGLLSKWDEYLFQSFVEQDPSHRYCPGPDCQCIATVENLCRLRPITKCERCETLFCFGCGERPHAPATCDDFVAWKSLKESSRFWMKHHSKPCPGCRAPIEKNGGCNHVRCSSCQVDFCWLCLATLNRHLEAHTCNRYDPVESAEDDFERYALFTATRFEAHDHAEDFAFQQLKSFRPEKLLEAFWFLGEDDAGIFIKGLEVLVQARCFLKHSYIATLGMRTDQAILQTHERHHSCLEMFTERLSQITEMNLHRLYLHQGEKGINSHFQRLSFFSKSVAKYQERMENSRQLRPIS